MILSTRVALTTVFAFSLSLATAKTTLTATPTETVPTAEKRNGIRLKEADGGSATPSHRPEPTTSSDRRLSLFASDNFPATRDPSIFADLEPSEIPQFVLVTFDDAVTTYQTDLYRPLTSVRDSRGCGIKATWYVSISYSPDGAPLTDCGTVNGLRKGQHEIATHTYGHVGDPSVLDIEAALDWLEDECGMPREEMRGFRTPNLKFTQDTFDRLNDMGILYDSSIGERGLGSRNGESHLWPYTMDNGIPQNCKASAGSCDPNKSLPGMWEVPMWSLVDENDAPMVPMDFPGDAYENLKRNFDRRYNGNRAPLGIYLHSSWLLTNGENLKKWAEEVLADYDDVYFVTNFEMIEWMRNPVPASQYATTRDCEGQMTNCIPPEGGCNHGSFDADQCACECSPPYVDRTCRFLVDPTSSPTSAPTGTPTISLKPTRSPKPTHAPTISMRPTKTPTTETPTAAPQTFAPTPKPQEAQDSIKSNESVGSLSSSNDSEGMTARENGVDETAALVPDSTDSTGGPDEDSGTNALRVCSRAIVATATSLMLVLLLEI